MPYTAPSLGQAATALASRLNDQGNVRWVQAELFVYIREAIRTWNAWTSHFRDQASFNTVVGQAFYDLPTELSTLRPQTVTNWELVTDLQYALMEPPAAGGTWTGTDQFTLEQLSNAIWRRRDQFLRETGAVLTRSETVYVAPAASGRIALDEAILQVRRAAWQPTLTTFRVPLLRADEWGANHYTPAWPSSSEPPSAYSVSVTPPLTLQLIPPGSSLDGTLDLVSVNKGATVNELVSASLEIPDDWAWVVKYGALADLLGGDGLAIDPQRAAYCVPLDSEILTNAGWRKYSDLKLGESVLGYNSRTGLCEWTTLDAINIVRQQEVFTYESPQFRVRCTSDHRWVMRRRNPRSLRKKNLYRDITELRTFDVVREDARVIQAAPAPSGPGLNAISVDEYMKRNLGVEMVLQMTSGERRAFILGMMYGEGNAHKTHGTYATSVFSQKPGPVYDAMKLACALEGIATSRGRNVTPNNPAAVFTLLRSAERDRRALRKHSRTIEDVWCPTTGLGTWVMRQGTMITITGNCESRWANGVEMASAASVVLAARINGSPCTVGSLNEADTYSPTWQLVSGTPRQVLIAGQTLLASWPPPGAAGGPWSITLDVVRNAPVPSVANDILQIGADIYDSILDLSQHLALFKEGPGQLQVATGLLERATKAAGVTLALQQASQPARFPMLEQTQQDEHAVARGLAPLEVT